MPIQLDAQILRQIKKRDLRYFADEGKGITRKGAGAGFGYFDGSGVKIANQNMLERIRSLSIPPAWKDVWISPYQNSHLQATGVDDRGRKQYIYHPKWTAICQEHKFDHLLDFCEVLPVIRRQVSNHLKLSKLEQKKIIATVVWLLEHTFIRIGNDEYAADNGSFGLTTLRNKHVSVRGKKVKLEFTGKSHVHHNVEIVNPVIIRTIKSCLELPGYELFQYIDDEDRRHPVDSGEVNDYLQGLTGQDITAKDFRTWGATLLAADTLCKVEPCKDEKSLKYNLNYTVKQVAKHLRNTPTICRKYYIHPTIFNTYEKEILINYVQDHQQKRSNKPVELTIFEDVIIQLLHRY